MPSVNNTHNITNNNNNNTNNSSLYISAVASRPVSGIESKLLSRAERIKLYGLDYTCDNNNSNNVNNECVIYPCGWHSGGDYIGRINIINVSAQMLRISYQLPSTKYFYMDYPDPIDIAPGIKYTLLINFRPVTDNIEYKDQVTIINHTNPYCGKFYIPLIAAKPQLKSNILPNNIDFNIVPTNEITERTLELINNGELSFNYSISLPEPFELFDYNNNYKGELSPATTKIFKILIKPLLACHINGTGIIMINNSICHKIDIRAVSSVPHIELSQNIIDFGPILTAHKSDKIITLTNLSNVRTSFSLSRVRNANSAKIETFDSVFSFKPNKGIIESNTSINVLIQYSPLTTGIQSNETYCIKSPGGNNILFTCCGSSVGPRITVQQTIFEFNSLRIGEKLSKQFKLFNESSTDAYFQFQIDNSNSFKVIPCEGIIKPQLSMTITISFKPKQSINYYSQIYLFIRDQQPEIIHLIGTGYNDIIRPANLLYNHIKAHYCRNIIPSFINKTPQQISNIRNNNINHDIIHYTHPELDNTFQLIQYKYHLPNYNQIFYSQLSKYDQERFQLELESNNFAVNNNILASINNSFIHVNDNNNNELITIYNHTLGKLSVTWDLYCNPSSTTNSSLQTKNNHFIVTPVTADIQPTSSVTFKIQFISPVRNQYYYQQLVCYAYYKSNRTFRLVDEKSFIPPCCLYTDVFAHSFDHNLTHYMSNANFYIPRPKIKIINKSFLSDSKLQFPPTSANNPTFLTLFITNPDDTPLQFKFLSNSKIFAFYPTAGLIKPKQFQLFVAQFTPNNNNTYQYNYNTDNVISSTFDDNEDQEEKEEKFVPSQVLQQYKHNAANNNNSNNDISTSYSSIIECEFNYSRNVSINCFGISYNPSLILSSDYIYFKPTCYGMITHSNEEIELINLVSIPIIFKFIVNSSGLNELLDIKPICGLIKPNSRIKLNFSFKPRKLKLYAFKLAIQYRCLTSNESNLLFKLTNYERLRKARIQDLSSANTQAKQTYLNTIHNNNNNNSNINEEDFASFERNIDYSNDTFNNNISNVLYLRLRGLCSLGSLTLSESLIDFNCVELLSYERRSVILTNASESALKYELILINNHDNSIIDGNNVSKDIECSLYKGELGSNSCQIINITFNPHVLGLYSYKLQASIISELSDIDNNIINTQSKLVQCNIVAKSMKPSIIITDCRIESTNQLNNNDNNNNNYIEILDQSDVWNANNIDNINKLLTENINDIEIDAINSTHKSQQINFNFPTGYINNNDNIPNCCLLYIEFKNNSPLTCEFSFSNADLNNDNDIINGDSWYQPPQPNATTRYIQSIIDKKLFSITPNSSKLLPSQSTTICITYHYKHIGTHYIPITLNIKQSKSIQINLRGITESVSVAKLYLGHLPLNHNNIHTFNLAPIPLGYNQYNSPIQSIRVYNQTNNTIYYQFDCDNNIDNNIDYPLLTCINSCEAIKPGYKHEIRLIFRPLKCIKYSFNCKLQTSFHEFNNCVVSNPNQQIFCEDVLINGIGVLSCDYLKGNNNCYPYYPNSSQPQLQLINRIGELAKFDKELINFDILPINAVNFAICTIINLQSKPIQFSFRSKLTNYSDRILSHTDNNNLLSMQQINNKNNDYTLQFYPCTAIVEPNSKLIVKIKFVAGNKYCEFIDTDVLCKINIIDNTHNTFNQHQNNNLNHIPKPIILASTIKANNIKGTSVIQSNPIYPQKSNSINNDSTNRLPLNARGLQERIGSMHNHNSNEEKTNDINISELQLAMDEMNKDNNLNNNQIVSMQQQVNTLLTDRTTQILSIRIAARILTLPQIQQLYPHFTPQQVQNQYFLPKPITTNDNAIIQGNEGNINSVVNEAILSCISFHSTDNINSIFGSTIQSMFADALANIIQTDNK